MTKLEKMLKYVSEHNDFYKNRIKEYNIKDPLDITQWPILTREELQKNRYNMFSDGYKSLYFDQQLHRQTSSGTSGIPVTIYWDPKDYYSSTRALWKKRLEYYNILPNDKRIMFTLRVYDKKPDATTIYHINKNTMVINVSSVDKDLYLHIIELIKEFQPKWLYITPYVLRSLLDTYKTHSFEPPTSIKYIESVGEILSYSLKESAQLFFNAPIANLYGSEEMNGIAYECPFGKMHIVTENVYVEYPSKNCYKNGNSIITSVTNRAMPLIRYNQEDIIATTPSNGTCTCGCNSPILKIIEGRVREKIVIETTDNTLLEITPYFLNEIIEEVNNIYGDKIKWFSYVYRKTAGSLTCYIKLTDDFWFLSVKHTIVDVLLLKLGEQHNKINFDVQLQDPHTHVLGKNHIIHVEE